MMLKKKKVAWPFMPISDQSERFRARRLRPPRPRILLPCEDDYYDADYDDDHDDHDDHDDDHEGYGICRIKLIL